MVGQCHKNCLDMIKSYNEESDEEYFLEFTLFVWKNKNRKSCNTCSQLTW